MEVVFESGIPCPVDLSPVQITDMLDRARVACATALDMQAKGVSIEPTEEEKEEARSLMGTYAEADNGLESRKNIPAVKSSGIALHLNSLLDEYDKQVVQSSLQVKHYVTNKLIEETVNPKDNVRIRALELLGKDAGMFSDKTEVTVKHQSTEELEKELRTRLSRILEGGFLNVKEVEDVYDEEEVEDIESESEDDREFEEAASTQEGVEPEEIK